MDHSGSGGSGGSRERADRDTAFSEFVLLRSKALLRTAYLLTGDLQRAEDLMQTALMKAYVGWARLRDPAAVEAYVRRTMVTTNISWWRRKWRGEVPTAELPETSRDGSAERWTDRARPEPSDLVDGRSEMWPHVVALPARQRAAVVLRYYEDLTQAQIAEQMGCTVATVKSLTHRALVTLRASIDTTEDATPGGVR